MPPQIPPVASLAPNLVLPPPPGVQLPTAPAPPTIDVAKMAEGAVTPSVSPSATPTADRPAWRTDGPPRPGQRRRKYILLVLFGLFGLVGVFIGVLYWLSPPIVPAVLPIVIASDPNGEPLPWMEEDRAAFAEGGWLGTPRDDWSANPGRDQIRLRFRALTNAPRSQPVVAYLASAAGVDAAGGVYLLPADHLGDHPRNRLPLSELLAAFRDCPARNKLLILNLVPPAEDPLVASPPGELSTAIFRTLDANPDPTRLCLVSCGQGQRAESSPELGRTVFSWYLEAGLRGEADGWAGSSLDGRVSVNELASYVRDKVSRWAAPTGHGPQTPVLVGFAPDFTLRAVTNGRAEMERPAEVDFTYPDWLRAGWERHDQWQRTGRASDSPWAFRKLRAALLAAERDFLAGKPAAAVQQALETQLQAIDQLAAALAATPEPAPLPTLATLFPGYASPDLALVNDLREASRRLDSRPPAAPPAPGEKPAPEPSVPPEFDAFKTKPHAVLALAAFLVLSEDADPSPLRVRGLSQLLALQSPTQKFAETALISRLASLAAQAPGLPWSSEQAALALQTERWLEESIRPEVFAWAAPAIEQAYRAKANAEAAYFAPGYAPTAEATRRLRDAAAMAHRLQSSADQLRQATRSWHEATDWLLGATSAVQSGMIPFPVAEELARVTQKLGDALIPPASPLDLEAFAARVGELEGQVSAVRAAIAEFSRPFRGEAVAKLRTRAELADAGPAVISELDGMLASPVLLAADRAALWNARARLARRLANDALKADVASRDAIRTGLAQRPSIDPHAQPDESTTDPDGRSRIRWTVSLLRVGGLEEAVVKGLGDDLNRVAGDRFALAERLRRLWLEDLPVRLRTMSPVPGSRLATILPDVPAVAAVLDSSSTNPASPVLQARMQLVWAWQAGRFDYESRELSGSDAALTFALAAARACRALGPPAVEAYLELSPAGIPKLTPEHPSLPLRINVRAIGSTTPALVRVSVLSPANGWLKPGPATTVTADPLRVTTSDIPVAAGDSPVSFPSAFGVLVEAEAGGRAYHRRVPVSLDAITDRLSLMVRTAPGQVPISLRELRLRPNGQVQPYQLVLANPTPRERKVVVRLAGLGRETDVVTIPAGMTATLAFPSPLPASAALAPPQPQAGAKPPADEGLAVKGDELVLQLFDPTDRDTVRQTIRLPIGVANPIDYLRVTEPVFKPSTLGRSNRLSLSVIPGDVPPGGPCPVRLGFPADRNADGLAVLDGSLTGQVLAGGPPITLYADNLALPNPAGTDVTLTLSADGVERVLAYRGTLPSRGETLRLTPESSATVRVKTAHIATGTEPLPVTLEVDNAPTAASLELLIGTAPDRTAPLAADLAMSLPTAKDIGARLKFNDKGDMLMFAGAIRDHRPTLPVEYLVGRRVLEARLIDRGGKVLATDRTIVIFDGTPPQDVHFLDIPLRARKDQPLQLRATCDPTISGIKEVKFFLGAPQKTTLPQSPPPVAGKLFDEKTNEWRATLPVDGQKGVVVVGVQFVSNVGLSTIAVQEVELLDPMELNKQPPGHIAGKVLEGPLPQPDLVVFLYDDKGNAKVKTTTKADGTFAFKDLPPGAYYLFCEKEVTNRHIKQEVKVKPDDTTTVTLELLLK